MAGFWDGVRAIAARRRAEALDAAGHRQEAFAAFSEAAVFWERTNPVLAASLWSRASRQMAMVENRPAQLEASRRALDLLPPWQHWKISLAREFGQLALQICADALYWLDQLSEAESVALEAIAAAESFGTPWEMAGAYGVYSQALLRQDRPVQTLGAATRTVEIARTIGEPAFTATALTDHASALLPLAQYTAARKDVEEALALLGTLDGGPQHDQARIGSLAAAASVYRMTGDHERAMALADQAAQLCDLRGRREQYLQARMAWSLAAAEGGEHDRAAACAREVYEEAKQRDLRHVAGLAANNLAVIDARAGNLTRARAWSRRAMRLQDAEDLATRGAARCNLGFLSMIGGDFAAAQTDLLGAIDDWEALRRNVTDDRQYVDVLEEQARVYRALQTVRLALGDAEGALEAAERARGRGLLRRLRSREPEAGNPLMAGFTAGEAVALAAARKAGFLVYSAVSPASEPGEENSVAGLHAWYIDETGIAHASVGVQALKDLGLHTREDPFFGVTRDLQAPEQSDHEGMAEVELLSELLVRPLAQALARTPARLLVVVPDGELDRVPFAALRLAWRLPRRSVAGDDRAGDRPLRRAGNPSPAPSAWCAAGRPSPASPGWRAAGGTSPARPDRGTSPARAVGGAAGR